MSRIRIKNGDFERLPKGDFPSKLTELKGWEQAGDYPEDAGYNIRNYNHFNQLPENTWDISGLGPVGPGGPGGPGGPRGPVSRLDADTGDALFPGTDFFGWRPPANHFLDMGGTGQNSSLFQQVKNLKDEQPLTLSFDYFDLAKYHGFEEGDDSYYGASTLKVYWNYKLVAEISGDNSEGWAHIDINVMAGPNGEGDLKIYEKGTEGDNAGIAIDNVMLRPRMDKQAFEETVAVVGPLEFDTSEDSADAVEAQLVAENLVKNGSFEYFKGEVEEGGYAQFGRLPGWQPAEKGEGKQFEIHHETIGDSAPNSETTDGSFYLDTGLTPGNMAIRQQIKGVEAGDVIEISLDYFDHAMADGATVDSGRLQVWWDDMLLGQIDGGNAENWNTWSYRLMVPQHPDGKPVGRVDGIEAKGADGKQPSNMLTLREVGTEDNLGLGIDNVKVTVLFREDNDWSVTDGDAVGATAVLFEDGGADVEDFSSLDAQIESDLSAV